MPELPEALLRAREIQTELSGRGIVTAEGLQPKALNVSPAEFSARLAGRTVLGADHHGKWIRVRTDGDLLLINLGMGGEILLHPPEEPLPDKVQAVFHLNDGARLSIHFWWFGHLHLASPAALAEHRMTARLGIDALSPELTPVRLTTLLAGRRTRVKSLLLDQSEIAGVGNMYAHDILFRARLHPLRAAASLAPEEVEALWRGMRDTLQAAINLGGSMGERDLHGREGGFNMDHLLVGYKEGQPCPACGTTIVKIRTGSTAGFICPRCQPEPAA